MLSKQQKGVHLNSIHKLFQSKHNLLSDKHPDEFKCIELPEFFTLLLSVNKVLVLTINRHDFLAIGVHLNTCLAGNAFAFLCFRSVQE